MRSIAYIARCRRGTEGFKQFIHHSMDTCSEANLDHARLVRDGAPIVVGLSGTCQRSPGHARYMPSCACVKRRVVSCLFCFVPAATLSSQVERLLEARRMTFGHVEVPKNREWYLFLKNCQRRFSPREMLLKSLRLVMKYFRLLSKAKAAELLLREIVLAVCALLNKQNRIRLHEGSGRRCDVLRDWQEYYRYSYLPLRGDQILPR